MKRQRTDNQLIVGTITKEVGAGQRRQALQAVMRVRDRTSAPSAAWLRSAPACVGPAPRGAVAPPAHQAPCAPPPPRLALQGIKRTSNLYAPIMQLSGHEGEVFSMRFHPDGEVMASGSFDKLLYVWKVYGEECENHMVLR